MPDSHALTPARSAAARAKLPQRREQAISRRRLHSAAVGHWPDADVRQLAAAAGALARGPAKVSRDELLVLTLYDATLMVRVGKTRTSPSGGLGLPGRPPARPRLLLEWAQTGLTKLANSVGSRNPALG